MEALNDDTIKRLTKKFAYNFNGIIGHGNNGLVYDVGENMDGQPIALKQTSNIKEAIAANKLIGKGFKNVVNVYKVYKFKFSDNNQPYFIEMEKLRPVKLVSILPEILEYLINYDRYKGIDYKQNIIQATDNPEETIELLSMYNEKELPFIYYTFWKSAWSDIGLSLFMFLHKFERQRKAFNDLVNGLEELYSAGIYHIDIHEHNIMKRDRDYVLSDISSESLENLTPLLNASERIPLLEKKIQYMRTAEEKHQGLRNIALEDWSGMMIFTNVKEGDIYVGEDCLFDIRIAFVDMGGKILSVGIIKKGDGRVIAPAGTQMAVETAADDDYQFTVNSYFRPEKKNIFSTYSGVSMG